MNIVKLDQEGFATACQVIRSAADTTRETLNEWGPLCIAGVYAGDNIGQVNQLVDCFDGILRERLIKVLKRILPFKVEEGKFTTKENEGAVKRKTKAFTEFCDSEIPLYTLLMEQQRSDRDKKPTNYVKKLERDAVGAIKQGLKLQHVLAIVQAAAMAAEAEQVMEQAEKEAEDTLEAA